MPSDCEGLYQRSDIKWEIIWQFLAIVFRSACELTHATSPSRKTNEAKGVTRIGQASGASSAVSIVNRWLHCDPISRLELFDSIPDLINDRAELVPQDDWRAISRHAMRLTVWRDDMGPIKIFMKITRVEVSA